MNELFQSKENRDRRAKELLAKGLRVRRSRVLNQRLHPNYVQDAEREDNGFGNSGYLHEWPVLYTVEAR